MSRQSQTKRPDLFFVGLRPYRSRRDLSIFRHKDLLHDFQCDLHVQAIRPLKKRILEGDKTATLVLRLHYGLAQEAFFALLFATLQAPFDVTSWLLLYQPRDLRTLILRFQTGTELPSLIVPSRPGDWENLALELHPEPVHQRQGDRRRIKSLGRLWKKWAEDQLDQDRTVELNSIKHGLRARPASPSITLGEYQDKTASHGSSFPTRSVASSHIALGICTRFWSAKRLLAQLELLQASSSNLVELLRLIHGAGDQSRLEIEVPDRDLLARATMGEGEELESPRSEPNIQALKKGAKKLSYADTIDEYRTYGGTIQFGGQLEEDPLAGD